MAVRLLIAVLMLAGPTPANVCTCAAAGSSCPPAGPTTPLGTGHDTGCGCPHPAPTGGELTAADSAGHDRTAESPADTERHEPSCPAVNPRPAVPTTAPTSTADLPADPGVAAPSGIGPPDRARHHVLSRPGHRSAGPVPLYLSLLSLRI